MTRRFAWTMVICWCLQLSCSSKTTDEPITPWNTEKCVPGSLHGCTCGAKNGVTICDYNGLWETCDCTGDIVIDPDALLPGDAKSTPPSQANLPATVSPVSGVGRLKSENYELQVIIGPTSPTSAAGSEHYKVQLGPIGARTQ